MSPNFNQVYNLSCSDAARLKNYFFLKILPRFKIMTSLDTKYFTVLLKSRNQWFSVFEIIVKRRFPSA
ncbi:hypothetical protein ASG21_10490 [Chryseobacterium sp. Leaf394]|nr:hypothetical protein ASG21_10490 [Chryseobacterium sp. Leaf394]